jgi:hypothetical protein
MPALGRLKVNKTHTIIDWTGHAIKRDMTDKKNDLLRNSK